MNLSIFGGTGRTGRLLIDLALDQGHAIRALARSPVRLGPARPGMVVITGDARDREAVAAVLAGSDAVLSVLGPTRNEPVYEVSDAMEVILEAMRTHGVRRLIQTAGAGVGDPLDRPRVVDRIFGLALRLAGRHVFEDMRRTADLIRASDSDWTVVRVPRLTDGPPAPQLRVGYLGDDVGVRVSRADVAAFMLAQLTDRSWVRQAPVISA